MFNKMNIDLVYQLPNPFTGGDVQVPVNELVAAAKLFANTEKAGFAYSTFAYDKPECPYHYRVWSDKCHVWHGEGPRSVFVMSVHKDGTIEFGERDPKLKAL